jgi:nudix-type nucleoside diphosphatase (YffH/AdpP family)
VKPTVLSTRVLHQGWARFLAVTVRLEDGQEVQREIEDHGRAVAVLPYDPERRTALLVRLLRTGPLVAGDDPFLLEAPAGMIDDGDAEATARREALEEAGVRLTALEPLGAPYSTPGVSTERIALFLAPYGGADRVAAGGGLAEEHENIRVTETPLADLWAMVEAGAVRDLKTLALALALKVRRPELFEP